MIAIPVDSATPGVTSSPLFGNVAMFAVYKPVDEEFFFIRNKEAGDGVKTAKQLKTWGVESVVYSHMGKGPFGALSDDGVEIYYIGKDSLPLFDIIKKMEAGAFIKVDEENAEDYLDPGTNTGSCECGCNG
ncbi:MAG: NifB/NifX family molybdenum-iron cluster-binding protein [Sulfurimonadaceae bacterium]|nr:NifB/NifX family molybdenum-iron cluster-binding protein [Sulfurimonadaceae bacterium]